MKFKSYIEKHLSDRDFPEDAPVYIDRYENIAYFPMFNLSGKFVGYQKYNPKGSKGNNKLLNSKYYTYVGKENTDKNVKYISVYGLHTIDNRPFIFVVEGIFDAAKLMKLKLPVIAVLTNNPKQIKNFLFILQKKVIAWLDSGSAGRKLRNLSHVYIETPDEYKDLGDIPLQTVKEILLNNTEIMKIIKRI